jgi:hypothetical protein
VPIDFAEVTTAGGFRVVRSVYNGEVSVRDAEAFMNAIKPGSALEHCGHLVLGNVTSVSGEVRKVMTSQAANPANPPPVALVITSAIVRMVASLVARGTNPNTEFFGDEAEARTWLDERMKEYERRRAGAPKR